MNYLEVKQVCKYLESIQQPHQFLVFNGKHQWPTESTLSEALTVLELYAMHDSLMPINSNSVTEYLDKTSRRIVSLKGSNCPDSLGSAYALSKQAIGALDGLIDLKQAKTVEEELLKNPSLQKYLADQSSIDKYELQKQEELVSSFGLKSEAWWNSEIKQLNDAVKTSTNVEKVNVSKRLLGYISLSCYGYVNGALHYKDWKTVAYFASIYRQVDPENPDCWYAIACLQANTEKPNEAISSLKNALKFGFSDYSKLKNDPLLNRLRGLDEFINLVRK